MNEPGAMTSLIDAAGYHHRPHPEARILSLVPSLTETLFALGLGDQVVGRTTFCIHPADQVKNVKSVGGTKQVNWRKVEAVQPTHAILNIDENPKAMAVELDRRGIIPVVTHPLGPEDNGLLVRLLGDLFDRSTAAAQMAGKFDALLEKLVGKPDRPLRRVLYLIWKDPWMTVSADTYISRLLSVAGWQTAAHSDAVRYPEIDLTETLLNKIDLILFSSEPFRFTEDHLSAFCTAYPAHAAKARQVDGEMLSWYGVRAIDGLKYLDQLASEHPR